MARLCPKLCSRLLTSATLIALGVIQNLVGVILLKSEHSFLVSGPDFMAGTTNMLIGCGLGLTASVWKNEEDKKSVQYVARRNVVASLFVTTLVVNGVAVVILIFGEGKSLLPSPEHFVGRLLASAYVTSVCSPIIGVVIAIFGISGSCFKTSGYSTLANPNSKFDSPFSWVFENKSKTVSENPSLTRQSCSEDSVFQDAPMPRQPAHLDLSSPVRSWNQKRDRYLDSSLQQTPTLGRLIPRVRELKYSCPDYNKPSVSEQEPVTKPCSSSTKPKKSVTSPGKVKKTRQCKGKYCNASVTEIQPEKADLNAGRGISESCYDSSARSKRFSRFGAIPPILGDDFIQEVKKAVRKYSFDMEGDANNEVFPVVIPRISGIKVDERLHSRTEGPRPPSRSTSALHEKVVEDAIPERQTLKGEVSGEDSAKCTRCGGIPAKGTSLKKTSSFSPKNLLRKIRPGVKREDIQISNLIVDEDSLIGLNDKELLARTMRIRQLNKLVNEKRNEKTFIYEDVDDRLI